MSEQANILDKDVSQIPLESIPNLDSKLVQNLATQSYHTVGDIYHLQAEGITILLEIEYELAKKFWEQILAVTSNPERWPHMVLGAETTPETPEPKLPEILQTLLEYYFVSIEDSKAYTVLVRRFGLNNSRKYSLDEIGSYFGFSKERARQIQTKSLQRLREYLLESNQVQLSFLDNYDSLPISMFLEEIKLLKQTLETEGLPIKSEEELFTFITNRYHIPLSPNQKAYFRLLFQVFGWELSQ